MHRTLFLIVFTFFSIELHSQRIMDPCLTSLNVLGKFHSNEYITNLCGTCNLNYDGANILEWTDNSWEGQLPFSNVKKPPPPGCNNRAIWIGDQVWTGGGEAVGFKLDKPLKSGETYSFKFTYARDGKSNNPSAQFSPIVYSSLNAPTRASIGNFRIGRLPETIDWKSDSITFVTTDQQSGHKWIILHAVEASGLILAACNIDESLFDEKFTKSDTTFCDGETIELRTQLAHLQGIDYNWSTGSNMPSIEITQADKYELTVTLGSCIARDSIVANIRDCETRFVMPNVVTVNNDNFNEMFLPIDHNYIASAKIRIYNRWGEVVFIGDPLKGWSPITSSPGMYYYEIEFVNEDSETFLKKGNVHVLR